MGKAERYFIAGLFFTGVDGFTWSHLSSSVWSLWWLVTGIYEKAHLGWEPDIREFGSRLQQTLLGQWSTSCGSGHPSPGGTFLRASAGISVLTQQDGNARELTGPLPPPALLVASFWGQSLCCPTARHSGVQSDVT